MNIKSKDENRENYCLLLGWHNFFRAAEMAESHGVPQHATDTYI
jgi:hypothetical protein